MDRHTAVRAVPNLARIGVKKIRKEGKVNERERESEGEE